MSLNKINYGFFGWYRENKNTIFAEYLLEEGLNETSRKMKTFDKGREIWKQMTFEEQCQLNIIYGENVNKITNPKLAISPSWYKE